MKKVENLSRPKLLKNVAAAKGPNPNNSLYAGVASAQRSLQKQSSSQLQSLRRQAIPESSSNTDPPRQFHSWKPEYNQMITREKIKKSMTKDPYLPRSISYSCAKETITTQEEYCPEIIPAEAVHIEVPLVQQGTNTEAPRTVHWVLDKEPLRSEEGLVDISVKSLTEYQLTHDSSTSSMTTIGKPKSIRSGCFSATDRLLRRPSILSDPSLIRRPPRRLTLNITRDTIIPLTIYG